MGLQQDVQGLETPALISLYVLDLNPIGEATVYRFYPGVDLAGNIISYQSLLYFPWPIKIEGMERSGVGAQNRPKLSISNKDGYVGNIFKGRMDLIGATVTRIRTADKYLDGEPTADPNAYVSDTYIINSKLGEGRKLATLELASPYDFNDQQLPARKMQGSMCPFLYKGTECGWVASNPSKWFDRFGSAVGSVDLDVCGKRLADCKLRFGTNVGLPYGGFPGVGRV